MPFSTLPTHLGAALAERGYTELTSVQSAVLEPEAAGRDLIVSAQTGSGKTVAFGLAFAPDLLAGQDRLAPAGDPLALIITPTRELAIQVQRELEWLYRGVDARVTSCVGGMDVRAEQKKLSAGVHIVVGTPGRLRDHLERGKLVTSSLKVVVLDEADEMLDMGFRDELEEILDATPADRRTLMFSATIPPQIASMAKAYQRNAHRIAAAGNERGHVDIAYQAVAVAPNDIEHATVNLLRFHESEVAIVFCATRENVRRMHGALIERGFDAVALSGEHSQSERNSALQALRDRRARVCVATDVAARGLDLPDLRLVIHAELPRDAETLQHRSGRTGRAGKKGTAVLIVPFPRRRRVEGMLKGARIAVEWIPAPTADSIRDKDQERLIERLMETVEHDEADLALGRRLLEQRSAEDIAAALVRMHRAKMPAPEDLLTGNQPRADAPQRGEHRAGFEDVVWFKMSVGRRHRADPRWLLPLLCRRGHITKNEVGAIRIADSETYFQVPRAVADKFASALSRTEIAEPDSDNGVRIVPSGPPPAEGRGPKPQRPPSKHYQPRPTHARKPHQQSR